MQLADPLLADVTPDAARRLLLCGIEAFATVGYHATTTREIAERAGMSPAALYVHYASKAELLREIIQLGHRSALDAFQSAFDDTTDPARRIAGAVHNFTVWHARNQTLARVVQYELEALPDTERRQIHALRTHFETMLRREMERGIEAGSFDIADIKGTATAIFSLCIDVARWYSPRSRRSPERIGELYADLTLRMLARPRTSPTNASS